MLFDENNIYYQSDPEFNILFLKAQENAANDLLVARGHVLLNDVYDAIGLPRTQEGAHMGWLAGEGKESVSFGIPRTRGHIEPGAIELTFNAKENVYAAFR